MAIELVTFLKPKGLNTYYLLEDKFIKGGLHACADNVERDAINSVNRKAGMVVVTQDTQKLWILQADKITWTELVLGGGGGGVSPKVRQSLIHTTASLAPNASELFTLDMGSSCLLYNCSVNVGPCEVKAFSTPTRDETNPYAFKALSSHLVDDGTTYLSDGTAVLGRRYSVLMNLEETLSNNIYWTVTNKQTVSSVITLTVSFLPLE